MPVKHFLTTDKGLPGKRVLVRLLIAACVLFGVLRCASVLMHEPLLAYANSYDEVRYTACFDLYPDRPREIAPTDNSPWAPFAGYVFIDGGAGEPICYWSSELLPQAVVVAGWKIAAAFGDAGPYSVRAIGVLKVGLLVILNLIFSIAWLRRRRPLFALANAALLPLLFADPANTLYANTFYAEWTALTALYATLGLMFLYADQRRTRLGLILLACAALALGTSKVQHLVLPLLLGVTVLVLGKVLNQRWRWQGLAIGVGGLLALVIQGVQLGRATPFMENMRLANAADVALTALLPASSDPARSMASLGLDPTCIAWIGRHAWELPNYNPEASCPGITQFSRGKELKLLLHEPGTAVHLGLNGFGEVDSWLAKDLGTVAGGSTDPLPKNIPSLGRVLFDHAPLRLMLILSPLVAFCVLALRPKRKIDPADLLFSALAAVTIAATYLVTIFGDGLADVAKQCHLVFNMALAWNIAGGVLMIGRVAQRLRSDWPRFVAQFQG